MHIKVCKDHQAADSKALLFVIIKALYGVNDLALCDCVLQPFGYYSLYQ